MADHTAGPPARACIVPCGTHTHCSHVNVIVMDDEHGGTMRMIHTAPTAMIRRHPQMPCDWALVYEQGRNRTPWLGEQQSALSPRTPWRRRARAVEVCDVVDPAQGEVAWYAKRTACLSVSPLQAPFPPHMIPGLLTHRGCAAPGLERLTTPSQRLRSTGGHRQ